jgi:hypothetical protein
MRVSILMAAAFVGATLSTGRANAEASSHDKAMASQLFDDAERLFAAGKFLEACPKYNESYRLDSQLGTLLHLGECYAKIGKTAGAWVSFKDALELAVQRGDPREKKIRDRVHQLETSMPKLVITVSPNAPADLEIRQDGELVARVVWGSPVPIDPGIHTISVKAYGRKPWIGNVQIAAVATTFEVKIPDLAPETAPGPAPMPTPPVQTPQPVAPPAAQQQPPPPQPQPQPTVPLQQQPIPQQPQQPAPAAQPAPAPPPEPKSSPGTAQRVLGWTSIGLGAVGLGVGTVFALQRKSKLDDRSAICPSFDTCTADDVSQNQSLTDDAKTASTLATVGFVAGGVLAATGLILVITAPSGQSKESVALAPVVGPGFQGVSLAGKL